MKAIGNLPRHLWKVLILSIILSCTHVECRYDGGAGDQQLYFTAAVFEHHRLGNPLKDTPSDIVRQNLDIYTIATNVAKKQGADIIIFPEYGLYPELSREKTKSILETVPDPLERNWNPCLEKFNDTMLFSLSCMARKYEIVVVANMGDKQSCDPRRHHQKCPNDGVFLYNANVAFDRDGKILSRYRKEHLFFESSMNIPTEPQFPVFSTDFGTFAMFVCFDSIFKPMAEISRRWFIDAVLLPTEWLDMLPQLDAIVYWQAWATGNNISLLVANGQYPYQGSAGSGIFSANLGPLKYTYNPDGLSKLVVSRVPRKRHQLPPFPNPDASITIITKAGTEPFYDDGRDVPDYCLSRVKRDGGHHMGLDYRCNQMDTTRFSLVKLSKNEDSLSLYNNGMSCSLEYSAELGKESYYFGLLNDTYLASGKYFFTQEMCFVFRCDDASNGKACSVFPMRSNTIFNKINITATSSTKFVYPSAVHTGMRLAPKIQWNYKLEKTSKEGSYTGNLQYVGDGSSPLLTAGLYGRNYDRDPPYVQ